MLIVAVAIHQQRDQPVGPREDHALELVIFVPMTTEREVRIAAWSLAVVVVGVTQVLEWPTGM